MVKWYKGWLYRLGFGDVWSNQGVGRPNIFLRLLWLRIKDCHLQEFHSTAGDFSRLTILSNLDVNPCELSLYLRIPLKVSLRRHIARIRLSAHPLGIETGRWHTPQVIPREERVCKVCSDGNVEDEFHFIMICDVYENLRHLYIPRKYLVERTQENFIKFLKEEDLTSIRKFSLYLSAATSLRESVLL